MRRSSVRNACKPANEGGMRFDMAYRPAMGFLAHSMVHSVFILARSCRWSFAMVVKKREDIPALSSYRGDRMVRGSERGEWGNGEEPNRLNEGDALVIGHIPPTEKIWLGTNIRKSNFIT